MNKLNISILFVLHHGCCRLFGVQGMFHYSVLVNPLKPFKIFENLLKNFKNVLFKLFKPKLTYKIVVSTHSALSNVICKISSVCLYRDARYRPCVV